MVELTHYADTQYTPRNKGEDGNNDFLGDWQEGRPGEGSPESTSLRNTRIVRQPESLNFKPTSYYRVS